MLPQGYTRVEWIQSTGSQSINTGVYPNQDTRVAMRVKIAKTSDSYKAMFGARSAWGSRDYSMWYNAYSDYLANYANESITCASDNIAGDHLIDKNKNTTYIDGVVIATSAYTTFESPHQMLLFAVIQDSGIDSRGGDFKIEDCQIYADTEKIRDYIPFVDSNGNANLWDDVNGMQAEKVGTFLHGASIVPAAPANLVQISAPNGLAFSWAPSKDANEYTIMRDGTTIASVYGDITSYTDIGALGEHTYTVTPYNGTQAGTGSSIKISTELEAPKMLRASLDGNIVTLKWNEVIGASGYNVYRDGEIIASVASASHTDVLIPPASATYTVQAYAGDRMSAQSEAVAVENWEGVLLTLITDRTAADVAEAKRLRDKLLAGEVLTDEEFARYSAGLRGCYNASDMNRVGAAVRYVANRLNAEGYGAHVSPKTDWQMEYAVRQSDWNKYLDEVRHLRRKLTLMRTTPQITDGMYSGLKNHAEANAIEQILVDLDWILTNIIRNYVYAGEVFAGEV